MERILIAISAAAAAVPMVGAYPINADGLNCRDSPGTDGKIVKTYAAGTDLKITCQTEGESISGDSLWDKTSDGCYVADYYVETGTGDYVTDKCDDGGDGGGDDGGDDDSLPGLDDTQSKNAQGILKQAKDDEVGHQGCLAGIATALVESSIYIYANEDVPESFDYPYDKVGTDYDSVGVFQQRAVYYPDIAADMDPAQSAGQFFEKMVGIDGWESMDVGDLCQAVQVSAYPDRYAERVPEAEEICKAGGV